jgi:hypothetical protein
MLRNSKDQAFFGAPLVTFPSLDKEYVAWFCDGVGLPAKLDVDAVYRLFEQAAFRPELLAAAADEVRFDFALDLNKVGEAFVKAVLSQIEVADAQTMRVIYSLTPLQSSVLRVMAAKAEKYAPFDEDAIKLYSAVIKSIAPAETVVPDVSNVQQALSALQDKGLVWREKRGVYALEETTTAELLRSAGYLAGL